MSFSYCQEDIAIVKIDTSSLDYFKDHEWVTKFNEQNLNPQLLLKNNKTHKLDSAFTKATIFQGAATTSFFKSLYFLYDHQDIRCTYSRSDYDSEWEPNNYSVDNYDDKGQLLTTSFNVWDGDLGNLNEDDPLTLGTYFYDDDNNLIEYHGQTQFEIRTKTLGNVYNFFYNEDGLIESREYRKWSVQEDSLTLRSRLIYDYKDGLIELLMEYDNDESRGYYASDSILYEYNQLGLLEKEIWYEKSRTSDDWGLNSLESTQYNNEAQIERKERRLFYRNAEQYMDTLLYNYHPYGSLLNITNIRTDSTRLGPFPDIRNELTFYHDSTVTSDQVRTFRNAIPSYEQNHMLVEYNENENTTESMYGQSFLTNIQNVRYFYSEIIETSTADIDQKQSLFSISPNPAVDALEIHFTNAYSGEVYLQLTDINGRTVMELPTYSDQKIDISHLSHGIYIYVIHNDNDSSTGKLVIH